MLCLIMLARLYVVIRARHMMLPYAPYAACRLMVAARAMPDDAMFIVDADYARFSRHVLQMPMRCLIAQRGARAKKMRDTRRDMICDARCAVPIWRAARDDAFFIYYVLPPPYDYYYATITYDYFLR